MDKLTKVELSETRQNGHQAVPFLPLSTHDAITYQEEASRCTWANVIVVAILKGGLSIHGRSDHLSAIRAELNYIVNR
jgi:hypothetical protein